MLNVSVCEPGAYDADIGDSPEDWATVYGITDDEIERKATEQREMEQRKYVNHAAAGEQEF